MTLRKSIAWLLAGILAMTAFIGSMGLAVAAEPEYTERAYQSKLAVDGGELTCQPKDTITVNLSMKAADAAEGNPFGVRAYDNTITIDTTRFEVVSAEPAIGLAGQNIVNPEYSVDAANNIQKIKWIHMSQSETADLTTELALGKIVLRVKENASAGTASILQSVEGIADHAGALARPSKVTANPLTLTVEDGKAAYRFGLETQKTALTAGEFFTVKAYLTSSAVQFGGEMASNRILFDRERFELISSQAKAGVQMSTNGGIGTEDQIMTLVYSGGGTISGNRLELAEFTLKLKENAETGPATIRQDQAAVKEEEGSSSHVSAPDLKLSVILSGECSLELTVRSPQKSYVEGDTLVVDLSIAMSQDTAPRTIQSEIAYPVSVFEVVSTAAISNKGSFSGDGGLIKYVYFDGDQSAPAVTSMELGSVTLRVIEGAKKGEAVLLTQEANLYDQNGALYEVRTQSAAVQIRDGSVETGVTVSGSVELTAGDVSKATVILTEATIEDAAAAYEYTAGAADYEANVMEDGSYTLDGVAEGKYTLLIRKPGALYYQKNNFEVGTEDISYKGITLESGDLDQDGFINAADLGIIINMANYDKESAEAANPPADLDGDGFINAADIGVIINLANYDKQAIVEE